MKKIQRKYKTVTWSSYRKIPNYEGTLEKISVERESIILFIAETLMAIPNPREVETEIADLAGKLAIPFDEALYYRWNYCQKIRLATERIQNSICINRTV